MGQAISRDQSKKMYAELRKHDLKEFHGINLKKLQAEGNIPSGDVTKVATAIGLLGKVAHQYDEEAFFKVLNSGDCPPLKLTPAEMEMIQGGGVAKEVGVIIVVVAITCALL